MSMVGCIKFMKWSLVVFNILVLCAGAIAIGLGAWGLSSEYGAEALQNLTGSPIYRGAAITIIVGGCVMVVIALLGCLGAILENRVLLGIYSFIMLLLLILFVVVASVAFAYRDIMAEKIATQMETTLVNQYGLDNDVTDVWDDLQSKLECCGVKGRSPGSSKSWYIWQSSKWFNSTSRKANHLVPESCCNTDFNTSLCVFPNSDTTRPVQVDVSMVFRESEYVFYKGCYDQLEDFVRQHILAIGGIAIGIALLMLLCIIFSICVCTHVGKKSLVV